MGERVAIVGSRSWTNWQIVRDYVYSLNPDDVVVSGGARGVDEWAEIYARERGLDTLIFYPDYAQYGSKLAPLVRNTEIASACDRMVAFWDGVSNGTNDAVAKTRRLGKPVHVFDPPETG
ncbi:MAG: DUF2493 domain-containing protein [Nitrospira sp.]